jgi:transcriptional regulator with XRE-family HTH domain
MAAREKVGLPNLRAVREYRGYSQRALAAVVRLAQPTICNYENGKVEPLLVHVRMLAEFLGVRPAFLLGDEPNEREKKLISRRSIS